MTRNEEEHYQSHIRKEENPRNEKQGQTTHDMLP